MDAVFAAMSTACETLLAYDNVQLYAPLLDKELVLNPTITATMSTTPTGSVSGCWTR